MVKKVVVKNKKVRKVSKKDKEKVTVKEINNSFKVSEISSLPKSVSIDNIERRLFAPVRRVVSNSSNATLKQELLDSEVVDVSREGLDSLNKEPSAKDDKSKPDGVAYSSAAKISGSYVSNDKSPNGRGRMSVSGQGPNVDTMTPKAYQPQSSSYNPNKPEKHSWDKRIDTASWSDNRSVMGSQSGIGGNQGPEYVANPAYLRKIGDNSDDEDDTGIVKRRKSY